MPRTLTTAEAAELLGVSIIRVRQLIERGQLPAERFGRQWAISERDVKAFKRLPPGKSGAPRKL